jgi:hypothetical protein
MFDDGLSFKRANFFPGLMATPQFWNEIQDYNFSKESMYNSIFHGQGVVPSVMEEFKVSSLKKGGAPTIIIGSGLAIDKNGRAIISNQPQAKVIDFKKYKLPTTVYIIVTYNEILDDYFQNKENTEFQGYKKKIETALVDIVSTDPSNTAGIEVGRIYLEEDENGEIKAISEAEDIINPLPNEIDTRFVIWACKAKRGMSPYLRKYLSSILEDTRSIASIANETLPLPVLRELQTVALTAKMLIQCGDVSYDDIVNILSPLYDINSQLIQEMLDYERNEEKRIFSTKEHFTDYRNQVLEMGELIRYYDYKLETIDKIIKLQKAILNSIKNLIISKKVTYVDIAYASYEFPRILVVGDDRYTLVEYLDFNDYETEKNHEFDTSNAKEYASSKQVFTYPDDVSVKDTVKRYNGGRITFMARNLIKKRELLLIRRTDIFHGNYKVDVEVNETPVSQLVVDGYDTKNRWRNVSIKIDEDLIPDSIVKFTFKMSEKGRDNFGKMWFYQKI